MPPRSPVVDGPIASEAHEARGLDLEAAPVGAPPLLPPHPPVATAQRRGPAGLNGHGPLAADEGHGGDAERAGCTAPQLRRFIKSRAYVPMHELRRRFAINGGEDDVTAIDLEAAPRLYVGLPEREGRLLGELLRAGDIGYELSLDPISPVVVGVFPMRPVPRS